MMSSTRITWSDKGWMTTLDGWVSNFQVMFCSIFIRRIFNIAKAVIPVQLNQIYLVELLNTAYAYSNGPTKSDLNLNTINCKIILPRTLTNS